MIQGQRMGPDMEQKKNPDAKPVGKPSDEERRKFLKKAAKVGVVTPAAMTLLLAAGSKRARAGPYTD